MTAKDNPVTQTVALPTGILEVRVKRSDWPLSDLLGFASRYNLQRGYLFVSKVLGKHIPVRPYVMARIYYDLAKAIAELEPEMPYVAIAMAETATGLGGGVFHYINRFYPSAPGLFLHTTRYMLERPVALSVDESHCHARDLLAYWPVTDKGKEIFSWARTLILIDDEISTGRTLMELAKGYLRVNPDVTKVIFASIASFLPAEARLDLSGRCPVPLSFVSLLEGSFRFIPSGGGLDLPTFNSVGDWAPKDAYLKRDYGRLGLLSGESTIWLGELRSRLRLDKSRPVQILGTGEFMWPPYLLAKALEDDGFDVCYQSTTRTPIALGGAIMSMLRFEDNYHDGIDNFLYNHDPDPNKQNVLCYETSPLPEGHKIAETLNAQTLFF
jgi:hypothetical protein